MPWTDDAIMSSVMQPKNDFLVLEVMTKMRGRCKLKVNLDGKPIPPLYPGCTLRLTQLDGSMGELPAAELHDASGGLENAETNLTGMVVLQAMRSMMGTFLPMYEPARRVFESARKLIPVLCDEDGRWPVYYLKWELDILNALGQSGGLERCESAFRHGDAIYISPRTGRAASRTEAGAFLDRMIPVPGFFMGKKTATIADIRQGHEMTAMLFEKFAMPASGVDAMPEDRMDVVLAMNEITGVAMFSDGDDENFDEDAYRRRLLSLRTLRVAERSSAN
ncbi:MAG: DNA repair protein RecO C-terminal domain-containing protein [Pseudomonadota bacterium]